MPSWACLGWTSVLGLEGRQAIAPTVRSGKRKERRLVRPGGPARASCTFERRIESIIPRLKMTCNRRQFLAATAAGAALGLREAAAQSPVKRVDALAGEVGITTSSLDRHVSAKGESGLITLMDLPKFI